MTKDELKVIKPYLTESKANDFAATYPLYPMFDKGIQVKENPEEANKYKALCAEQLSDYSFRLKSIKLINYNILLLLVQTQSISTLKSLLLLINCGS